MDPRVRQAMQLLKEASHLDLLVEAGARCEHPARQAASGVAATVAAWSPPRGSRSRRATQVGSFEKGARAWGFDVLSLGTGAGGVRERAHNRGERAGPK
ncbi:hypothetical protein NDU88_012169 [Pleurodeles waltl]|uniref:Uncharacterized protein n=1 Tax=Pleurodeles waltl TaxID=8319 RepID=A0AAV7R3G6_PLEWA|nr:hypothetical protein NDU88_012169 [Pleurodeles waltl]